MSEERRFKRHTRECRVTWNEQEVPCSGVTLDICPDGMFIVSSQDLTPGSVVDIQVWLDSETPICGVGKVIWVNRGEVTHYPQGFGVQFLDLTPDFQNRLLLFCKECDPFSSALF